MRETADNGDESDQLLERGIDSRKEIRCQQTTAGPRTRAAAAPPLMDPHRRGLAAPGQRKADVGVCGLETATNRKANGRPSRAGEDERGGTAMGGPSVAGVLRMRPP